MQLDSKKRQRVKYCPCGKSNKDGKFVPYIEHERFGYCHSCGQTFYPDDITPIVSPKSKAPSYMDFNEVSRSLRWFMNTDFARGFLKISGYEKLQELQELYHLGGLKERVIFWQIDEQHRVRSGKKMAYDRATLRRKGIPRWMHPEEFNLEQCFFGQHLLSQFQGKTVAIVESEKTALLGAVFKPSYLWLACGGKSLLSADNLRAIKHRKVMLFPDLPGSNDLETPFELWSRIAALFPNVEVSEFLEKNREGLKKGDDIGDWLLKFAA